jgi:superfamily II DNA or RNA helicase
MHRVDRLIAESPDWPSFWQALRGPQASLAGKAFERLTQLYLETHPEYRTQLRHVWRVPQEVPPALRKRLNLPSTDEGIDLVAETHDGKYWAVQCKFRADTSGRLTYKELATFTSLAFVTCRNVELAVVAHTCSKPVRKQRLLGKATEIGLDRWLALTDDDWRRIQAQLGGEVASLSPRSPRPHQQQAIDAASQHFVVAARGRMIMPCGTGKSLTAFWIARALAATSIVVAVPSLALIRQSVLDWTREFLANGVTPQWLIVCGDESTGKLDQDEFVGDTYDLGLPTTTDSDEIIRFLRRKGPVSVVFTTYQSSGVLAAAARNAGTEIDLIILDEAHKTVGPKAKAFAKLLSNESISARLRLCMTATERVVNSDSDDVLSMDDESVYGKRFYQLTFKEAIARKIISDYRIVTMTVNDVAVRELVEENKLVELAGDEVDAQTLASAVALRRAYEKHPVTHAISFHRSIKAAKYFCERQDAIEDVVPASILSLHVSSKQSAGERAGLMQRFAHERRALLTNARCLTEGVDIPAIDCVLFADPKQSVVDIVQAAGRALRPYEGKQFGYILLPLVVPSGVEMDAFAQSTAFKQVARTIAALSTQDERIVEQFRIVDHGRINSGAVVEIEGDVPLGLAIDVDAFAKEIGTRLWERVGRANWQPFEEARAFARGLGLRSHAEWRKYAKSNAKPADVPSDPQTLYANDGWLSWGDWLGSRAGSRGRHRVFYDAHTFAQSLGLRSVAEWKGYCASGRKPADIPANPNVVYANEGWKTWGDWLGTDAVAKYLVSYRPFEKAREYVRSLGLKSSLEYRALRPKGALPADIPSNPNITYAKKGWSTWGDWLGTGTVALYRRKYRPFNEARRYVRALNLTSANAWRAYTKSELFPGDVPAAPHLVYRECGWSGWGDWLGTENVTTRNRKYRSFEDARKYVHALQLRSYVDWAAFAKSDRRPPDIPSNPNLAYKRSGWVGYGDWIGTNSVATFRRNYRSFDEARAFVRTLGLKTHRDWLRYARSKAKPGDIPTDAYSAYANDGWISWGDWLGSGQGARGRHRKFDLARTYARSIGLRAISDWKRYCADGKLPPDIPAYPDQAYEHDGWAGWGDWLGSGRTQGRLGKRNALPVRTTVPNRKARK